MIRYSSRFAFEKRFVWNVNEAPERARGFKYQKEWAFNLMFYKADKN